MSSPSTSEEELVGDYLYNKVHGSPLPQTVDVKEYDLYSEEPWEIWDKYGGPELERDIGEDKRVVLYLFTKLKKQSLKGKRFLRSVGCNGGVWQGEDAPKRIETKSCVGFRKRYRYENPGSDQHGRWIMMEFSLGDYNGKRNDYVLCSLKKNKNTTRGRRKRRVCGEIESKQERPLKKQKGKEKTASTDHPMTTSEIPPSTPQPCSSVNSMDYSCVWTMELAQGTHSKTITVEEEKLRYGGEPAEECDDLMDYVVVDWTIEFSGELQNHQSCITVQEYCEIELLPNENCKNLMGWEKLS